MFIAQLIEEAKSMKPLYEAASHTWIKEKINVVQLGRLIQTWAAT
ncbi:hypothetical protein MtrunA17_Chr3g0096171 [Medicago truncatula]|uniref:Uncharacterized protein n=1 Tax=Medicago truncatula TaxID=3880 RepID=A0A396IV59_MEDTR|nr:hypothetical protein MtrunA17_Chr3g0096171 [Medicago truncatula]